MTAMKAQNIDPQLLGLDNTTPETISYFTWKQNAGRNVDIDIRGIQDQNRSESGWRRIIGIPVKAIGQFFDNDVSLAVLLAERAGFFYMA